MLPTPDAAALDGGRRTNERVARQSGAAYELFTPLVVVGAVVVSGALLAAIPPANSTTASRLAVPMTLGGVIAVAGLADRTAFRFAIRWFGLLIVGALAALRLVHAGPSLHYQHFVRWSALVATDPLASAVITVQALAVGTALVRRRAALVGWWRQALGPLRGALLAGAMVLSSAALSASVRDYAGELAFATLVQFLALGTVVLMVWALPSQWLTRLELRVSPSIDRPSSRIDRIAVGCAIGVTALTAILAALVYDRHPHVQDEVKYLYQARYFAAGHLAMAPPPVPRAFELYLMEVGSRGWFSVVPPGWPMVLAVGAWFGAPWLINPILSGANVLLAFVLFSKLYDVRTARLAILLLCASPWYLYLGMSLMPHTLTLTCLLAAALGVVRARSTSTVWPAWCAGAAVGFLTLVRQLDGLVVAVLLGLWSVGLGGRRLRIGAIAGLVTGTALVGALTLPYNWYFTGNATSFPIMAYNDRLFGVNSNAYGFGKDRGMGWALDPFPGHGPLDATINAALNTSTMNVELFGWATGSLLFVYFLLFGMRARGSDWLFVALAAAVFLADFFNYFSGGPDFGARYWFLMILGGVVLTVRGAQALAGSIGERSDAAMRVAVGIAALSAVALLVFVPWRAVDKYRGYLAMYPDVRELSSTHAFGRSLVLVRGEEFPDYASAAIYNPLDVTADAPVYAHARDAATNAAVLGAYRDRPVWILDGPSRTRERYRVVAGPLTPAAAAQRLRDQ